MILMILILTRAQLKFTENVKDFSGYCAAVLL